MGQTKMRWRGLLTVRCGLGITARPAGANATGAVCGNGKRVNGIPLSTSQSHEIKDLDRTMQTGPLRAMVNSGNDGPLWTTKLHYLPTLPLSRWGEPGGGGTRRSQSASHMHVLVCTCSNVEAMPERVY